MNTPTKSEQWAQAELDKLNRRIQALGAKGTMKLEDYGSDGIIVSWFDYLENDPPHLHDRLLEWAGLTGQVCGGIGAADYEALRKILQSMNKAADSVA